jgi:hypothetical protein
LGGTYENDRCSVNIYQQSGATKSFLLNNTCSTWFYNFKLCHTTFGCKKLAPKFIFLTQAAEICMYQKKPRSGNCEASGKAALRSLLHPHPLRIMQN